MRTSSEKRSIGKYRPESVRPDTGYGYGSGTGEDLQPFVERRAREFEWVRRHLPSENEGMAVSALLSIQTFGDRPTRESVLARLRAQGRTADQLREKGWL